ncbi:MAG: response regulator transcription factor [Eubacteriales bacterium]|nr:response regulator transcription factor [Eubacteriales bacterium]
MINTILVEDDIYMQKHFSAILRSDERFSIAGTFKDAFDVENRCGTDIDLVLMDVLTLHKHSGLAAGKRIKERYPHIKIVIITSLIDPNVLSEAKRGAADSLWYKDHSTEELLDVIIRTMNGERIFPGSSPSVEMKNMLSGDISPIQIEILRHYIRGFTYREIADKFGLSVSGVRWNISDMIEKGGFNNKEELIATAIENKLVVTTLQDTK